jgi:hypothetical protein
MEVKNELKFADIKRLVGEHLKTALNVDDFVITFAKHEQDKWRVNAEWRENVSGILFAQTALLTLDSKTGEILEFQKGKLWNF